MSKLKRLHCPACDGTEFTVGDARVYVNAEGKVKIGLGDIADVMCEFDGIRLNAHNLEERIDPRDKSRWKWY